MSFRFLSWGDETFFSVFLNLCWIFFKTLQVTGLTFPSFTHECGTHGDSYSALIPSSHPHSSHLGISVTSKDFQGPKPWHLKRRCTSCRWTGPFLFSCDADVYAKCFEKLLCSLQASSLVSCGCLPSHRMTGSLPIAPQVAWWSWGSTVSGIFQ